MAEYDALAGNWSCLWTYKSICTTSIAAAVALKNSGAIDEAGGTFVVVVGCPAEERRSKKSSGRERRI